MPDTDSARAQNGADKAASSEVSWIFEASIKPNVAADLKGLIREMSEQADASEPGTLTYHWFISEDGASGQTFERYEDSAAALVHLASFNENYADRLMEMIEPKGMIVYGNASAALRKELAGANPVYMELVDGFSR